MTLKVSRVQAKPKKIDGTTWDLPNAQKSADCGPIVFIGKAVGQAVGGGIGGAVGSTVGTIFCSQSASTQEGRDRSAPDLFVQVVAGDARYRTPIAPDTFSEAFDYPVIVPLEGIPAAGLEIQVLDQDQDVGAGELIGMVRATRRQLQDALTADMPILTLSDSQLDKIEIEVSRYSPVLVSLLKFDVNQEPIAARTRARAGELVTIRAVGKYSVADNREMLDQNGYTNGLKRGYNRKPDFENVNHAAAIAYIGAPRESHAALTVGSCVTAVAPISGQLHVGVNDDSVGNNKGSLAFEVQVSTPTIDQWRSGGAFACPGRPGQNGAGSPDPALQAFATPEKLDRAMITEGIHKAKGEVMACGTKSGAKGMVKTSVTVGADGGVASVSIDSTPDPVLGDCVMEVLRKVRFRETLNGGAFGYPFVF